MRPTIKDDRVVALVERLATIEDDRDEPQPNPRPLARVLSAREVATLLGVSMATLYRLRQAGTLPNPIRISRQRVGWRSDAIAAWLESRASVPPMIPPKV